MTTLISPTVLLSFFIIYVVTTVNGEAVPCGRSKFNLKSRETWEDGKHVGAEFRFLTLEANAHSLPWVVSIRKRGVHQCAGIVVPIDAKLTKTDILITTAQCAQAMLAMDKKTLKNTFKVVAGSPYLRRTVPTQKEMSILAVFPHFAFDPKTLRNDIAIILLDGELEYSDAIQPGCLLPPSTPTPEDNNGIVATWTEAQLSHPPASVFGPGPLMEAIPHISHSLDICSRVDPNFDANTMLCTPNVIFGEQGSPYFRYFASWRGVGLHGIVSPREHSSNSNGIIIGTLYTRIGPYSGWIEKTIADNSALRKTAKHVEPVTDGTPDQAKESPTVPTESAVDQQTESNIPNGDETALMNSESSADGSTSKDLEVSAAPPSPTVTDPVVTETESTTALTPVQKPIVKPPKATEPMPRSGTCGRSTRLVPQSKIPPLVESLTRHHLVGTEPRILSLPWIVSIRKNGVHISTGVLVKRNKYEHKSTNIVLASAESVHEFLSDFSALTVVIGGHYQHASVVNEKEIRVQDIGVDIDTKTKKFVMDIAVLMLAESVLFGDSAQPICLPKPGEVLPNKYDRGLVAGYEHVEILDPSLWKSPKARPVSRATVPDSTGPLSTAHPLNIFFVPINTAPECRTKLDRNLNPKNAFCSLDYTYTDKGAPYMIYHKLDPRDTVVSAVLHGILSPEVEKTTRKGKGVVFARVGPYVDWIMGKIRVMNDRWNKKKPVGTVKSSQIIKKKIR